MPQVRRYAGFAEESSFDVSPAPAAAFHVDMESASLDPPSDAELVYGGALTRGDRIRRPGFYVCAGNIVYGFDVRTIGWWLKWALGGYTFTAGELGAVNTHEIYAVDDVLLPSFCTRLGKDTMEHRFSGCVVNSLQLETSDSWARATLDVQAARDAKETLQELEDLLLPEEFPLAFLDLSVERAGIPELGVKLRQATVQISNNLRSEAGRQMGGSRHPARLPVGARAIQGTVVAFFEDTAELERFWGSATGPSAGGATEFDVALIWDAGDAGSVRMELPKSWWSQAQQQPSGRDEIAQNLQFRALVGEIGLADGLTDVSSEILVTIQNNQGEM